jgi:hypothetical protein
VSVEHAFDEVESAARVVGAKRRTLTLRCGVQALSLLGAQA